MPKEKFQFLRIPKLLFSEDYRHLSIASRVLYGLLLERHYLSAKNGWVSEDGNPYIYYPIRELAEIMNVSKETIMRLMRELERDFLIIRKKQGQGKPDIIFVFYFEAGRDLVKRLHKGDACVGRLTPKRLRNTTREYAKAELLKWQNTD